MKKILFLVLICLFTFSVADAQAYVVPNIVREKPAYNNSSPSPSEKKLPNISVTVGNSNGIWTYRFYSSGSFEKHEFTTNTYGRMIEDKGVKSGTYYITEDESGYKRVYLRYSNGAEQTGSLRYKYSGQVEFSTQNKVHKEEWLD